MSLRRKLRDRAVYWEPRKGSVEGQYEFLDPVEVACHWEEVGVEFLDRAGNRQLSKAVVYLGNEKIRLGVLWEGKLENLAAGSGEGDGGDTGPDPFLNDGAYEIRQVKRLRSTRSRNKLVVAYL